MAIALAATGLLVLVVVGGGLLISRHQHVSASVTIDAGVSRVYPLVGNLRTGWSQWNPLCTGREGIELRFDGPDEGPGASVHWTGKAGAGSLSFVRTSDSGVGYHTEMGMGTMKADGEVALEANGNATQVTWTDDLLLGGNPVFRWVGLAMGGMRRKNLADGLTKLKRAAEDPER